MTAVTRRSLRNDANTVKLVSAPPPVTQHQDWILKWLPLMVAKLLKPEIDDSDFLIKY